jgi:hypothetical protein
VACGGLSQACLKARETAYLANSSAQLSKHKASKL